MTRILLISHGKMAEGALNTLRIFTKEADITAISAYTDECDDPAPLVEKFFASAGEERILAFSDIVFGSVNQMLFPYLSRPNTYVFSGFNLPLLLQATTIQDDTPEEDIEAILDEGKNGIVSMKNYEMGFEDGDE